jgi:hypothetical protein
MSRVVRILINLQMLYIKFYTLLCKVQICFRFDLIKIKILKMIVILKIKLNMFVLRHIIE